MGFIALFLLDPWRLVQSALPVRPSLLAGSWVLFLLGWLPALAWTAVDSPGADLPGAADPAGVARFPRAWIVAYEREDEFAPREFVVSAVEKIRRELRIERKLRLDAAVLRVTYQVPTGTPLEEVVGHYQGLLGPDALFSCRGRDCGRSNGWANQVFQQAILYGPEANQFYIAADRGGELLSAYVIERGNRRIYVHVEALRPREEVEVAVNATLAEELAGKGFAAVEGVRPRRDGSVPQAGLAVLDALAPRLATFERMTLYVVCHLYGPEDAAALLASSENCARRAQARLQGGLAGEAAPVLIPFGAGPLLPRASGAVARVELVLPHRQQRD